MIPRQQLHPFAEVQCSAGQWIAAIWRTEEALSHGMENMHVDSGAFLRWAKQAGQVN